MPDYAIHQLHFNDNHYNEHTSSDYEIHGRTAAMSYLITPIYNDLYHKEAQKKITANTRNIRDNTCTRRPQRGRGFSRLFAPLDNEKYKNHFT